MAQAPDLDHDYPLSEVPPGARKGLLSTSILLFGFTFFTATMFAGGKMGMAFDFKTLIWAAIAGNLLLGLYAAVLSLIACRSGLNSVLMGRFCFGESGSKLSDFLLGFTQIGWYAWGTATIALVLVKMLSLPSSWTIPLMVLFGFGFSLTAFIGYKGMDLLSRVAVPAMLALLVWSLWIATRDAGGLQGLLAIQPKESMSWHMAITLVFGTFVSGATQDNTIYNFAAAGCNLVRQDRRGTITLVGAGIGTLLAIAGMSDMLIPFLILLGSIIPPIGGVIMADFFHGHKGRYPQLSTTTLPRFNGVGLGAYAIGAVCAYVSPWVAPLVGIGVAALSYVVLFEVQRVRVGRRQLGEANAGVGA